MRPENSAIWPIMSCPVYRVSCHRNPVVCCINVLHKWGHDILAAPTDEPIWFMRIFARSNKRTSQGPGVYRFWICCQTLCLTNKAGMTNLAYEPWQKFVHILFPVLMCSTSEVMLVWLHLLMSRNLAFQAQDFHNFSRELLLHRRLRFLSPQEPVARL